MRNFNKHDVDEVFETLKNGANVLAPYQILEDMGILETDAFYDALDNVGFECSSCAWWCEISELNDEASEDAGENICEGCAG